MKIWKNLNHDLTCKDEQFKLGEKKIYSGKIELCQAGYHAHTRPQDLYKYYDEPDLSSDEAYLKGNIVCEGEGTGESIHGDDKSVFSEIILHRILSREEVITLCLGSNTGWHNTGDSNSGDSNSGDRNSGHRNSGHSNSGHRNSGHRNSGDWNSGHRNSGHRNSGSWNSGHRNSGDWNSGDSNSGDWNSGYWNSCSYETGFFNSKQSKYINVFNKPCKREDWRKATKPNFIYFDLNVWVSEENMTLEEKDKYPNYKTLSGYLKTLSYKEAWQNAYDNASKKDIELLKELPNFDAKVFEEISGIKVK